MCVADRRSNNTTCKRYSRTVLKMRTHTHAHTRTHTLTDTHTHTHMHTHTHTHALLSQIGIQNDTSCQRDSITFFLSFRLGRFFVLFLANFHFLLFFPLMLQIGSQNDTSCERYISIGRYLWLFPANFLFQIFFSFDVADRQSKNMTLRASAIVNFFLHFPAKFLFQTKMDVCCRSAVK